MRGAAGGHGFLRPRPSYLFINNFCLSQIFTITNMNNLSWGVRCELSDLKFNSIDEENDENGTEYLLKNGSKKFSPLASAKEENFWTNILSSETGTLSPLSDFKEKKLSEKIDQDLRRVRLSLVH